MMMTLACTWVVIFHPKNSVHPAAHQPEMSWGMEMGKEVDQTVAFLDTMMLGIAERISPKEF